VVIDQRSRRRRCRNHLNICSGPRHSRGSHGKRQLMDPQRVLEIERESRLGMTGASVPHHWRDAESSTTPVKGRLAAKSALRKG
jgi:hypothetical protein